MFKKIKGPFSKTKKLAKKQPEILRYEELEQRLLFSADVVPGLDSIAVEEQVLVENVTNDIQAEREAAPLTVEQTAEQARSELVLVNENVADYEQLIADLKGSDKNRIIEAVVLESDRDGIEQVSEILAERNDLDAIHIISHGSDGAFSLGGDWLNNADLLANSETIAAWGNALSEDADILLYGCNVAADVDGQNLTDTLAVLTGADVAASDDKTGHEDLGADWALEYQTDTVEASTVLDNGVPWEHTLGVVANQAPWTNLAVTTDRSTTISETYTVTATPGSDRLLLATMVTRFGFDQTIDVTSASFGGVQMHEIVEGSSDATRNGVWMGYLLESEIPAGEQTLTVSFTSTVSDPTGTKLLAATYVGVDQTTPINDSSANNTKVDAPISFGSQIDYVAGAEVVYVASFGGNTNTNTTEPAGYSKIYTNEWSGLLMTTIGHKDDTATAGYSPDLTAVDFEGTDANHSLAVVALNPVLNQAPTGADNTVTTDEDIPYTFSASDFNFSDTDGDTLDSVKITSLETVGSLQLSAGDVTLNQVVSKADIDAGNLKFVPVASASGPGYDSFGFSVNDGTIDSAASYTMTIDVTAVNDAPTFIDGSVGNWNFDEGSGDSTVESAIGISTGTLGSTAGADANDPTWTTGKFGQALHFDGVEDYVEIADAPGIDISGSEFSASLWVKPDRGPDQEDMFFMKGDRQGIGNVNYYLSWKDTNKMTWAFKSDGGFEYLDIDVTLPTVGEWNHIAVVFNRPTVSLYINGTEYTFNNVATGGTSMDKDLVANDEPLWIGAGRDGGDIVTPGNYSAPFSGAIDEFAIFDRALTGAEIEAIRTSTPPAVTASAFSIDENSANNTVVGTVVANDQDIGDTLSYAITAGNTGGAFSIDANGQIKVANSTALDFETNPTFNLTIEVDDGNGGTDTDVVTITLNDINDAPIARPDGVHLSFDGNDFVQVADATSLQMTNNVTIEAWINRDGTDTGSKIIVNKEGEYELGITADTGEIKFAFAKQGTPDTWAWHNTGYFVTAGEWTHVAVTYDGVAGEAKTYINGELVDNFAQSGVIGDVYPTFNELWIGGRQNDPADRFKGQIDEVRVWSTTRTQGEIQASMGGQLTGGESGLAGNWRLDEAFGSVAVDQSASGNNNGVLGGSEGAAATPTYQGYFISEDSLLTVSAGLGLLANDFDADGDTLTVTNINTTGMLGSLVVNAADGSFTYDPRGVLDSLGAGERLRETFTYTANDGSADSSPVTVTIMVVGVNDAATVSSASVTLNETDAALTTSGTLTSSDVDNPNDSFTANSVVGTIGTFSIDAAGAWSFTANSAFDSLNLGDNVSETYTATSIDGTSSTVTVQIDGTNDAATVSSASQTLTETDAPVSTSGTLTSTDVDNTDDSFTADTIVGTIGTFTIDAAGAWTFTANSAFDNLNVGDNVNETYTVMSIDGTSSSVTVQIDGTNDAATVSSASQTLTETDAALSTSGTLTSTDVDNTDDSFTADTIVGTIGTFTIDAAGAWTFTANSAFDNLNVGDNVSETYTATSIDGTSSTVTVQIDGTNDAATVSSASQTLTETDAPVSTSGTLTSTDVDNTDDSFTADTIVGTIGTFTIDAAGAWTFTANSAFDNLNVGDNVNETFNVTSVDGTASTVTITINGTNDTPTIESTIPDQALSENFATYTIDLNAAFADAETADNALIYGVSGNTAINVSIAGGIATITSTAGWNGSETLTFTATDEGGLSVSQDVVFTVAAVNDLPTIESTILDQSLNEDFAGYTIDLNAAFADVETTDANLIYGVSGNTNVNVSIVGGIATISATADWNGSETLTFTATDEGGLSVSQDVVFAVAAVADIADDPAVVVVEDTATIIAVLANDSFEGTPVVSGTTAPTNGAVVINGDNTITYTPDADYTGPDSFTYTVTSGGVTETATVTVNVTPANDVPTIESSIADQNLSEDFAGYTIDLNAAFADVETTDANLIYGVSGNTNVNVSIVGGIATISATADWNGSETLTFTATDEGGLSVSQDVVFAVAAVADIADDPAVVVVEDTATIIAVLANDSFEGTPVVSGTTAPTNGAVVINGDNTITYTPDADYTGPDSFTYTVTSGGVTETATVTVNVTPVNDPATVSSASQTLNETDAPLTTSGTLTSTDVDNPDNTFTANTVVGTIGTFAIDAAGAWSFTANSAFDSLNVGDNVNETFTVTSIDGTSSTVTIQINGSNDAATVSSDSQTLTETDAALTTSGTLTSSDVDNTDDSFTANSVVGTIGTFSIDAAGAWSFTANSAFDSLNLGDNVSETYTVTSIDGTSSTVTIQIDGTNDAATVSSASQTLTETDAPVSTSGTLTSTDVDNTDDSFTADTIVGTIGTFTIDAAGAWTFTANSAFDNLNVGDNVNETFNVTSVDGTASTVTIIINGTNDTPTIESTIPDQALSENFATYTIDLNAAFADAETADNALIYGVSGNTAINVSIAGGIATITSTAGWNGSETLTFTATDEGGLSVSQDVVFTVAAVNDLPTIESTILDQSLNEDFAGYTIDLNAAFADAETPDNALIYGVSGNTAINVSIASGIATITPTADWNGSETLTFTATDEGGLSVSQDVVFAVAAVADIADDPAVVVVEDTATIIAVLANDSFEGTPVVSGTTAPTNGAVVINGDNTITYTPDADYTGPDSFTYTVTSGGVTETATVTVNVTPVNDPATVSSASQTLTETDAPLTTSGTLTSTDVDNPDNTFTANTVVGTIGTFAIDAAGAWSFTANSAFDSLNVGDNVNETFTVTSIDGTSSTVTIQINGSNDAATVSSDSQTLTETDAALTTSGTLTSSDVDNTDDSFTANSVVGTIGTFSIDAAGAWSFTANSAFDSLNLGDNVSETYTVTSIDGTSSTVTIQIDGTNDAATVSSASQTLTETDAPVSTSGTLTSTDVDNTDDSFTADTIVGTIGTFTIDAAGAWTFTANSAFDNLNVGDNVNETFNVTSVDGTASTVTIIINGTNDTPTIESTIPDQALSENFATYTIDLNAAFADAETADNALIYGVSGNTAINVSIAGGIATITSTAGWNGSETLTFTATDEGGLSVSQDVVFTVAAVNDLPTIESTILDQSLNEDFAGYTIDLNAAFADAETPDNALIYGVSGNTAINVSIASGIATITPTADWNGSETLTFTATDEGGLSVSQDVVFAVAAVADIADDPAVVVVEDTATIIAVLANDSFEGTPVVSGTTAPTNGAVVINGDNTITYTPDADYTGPDSFTYTVTSGGVTETATVTVNVTPVNDPATVSSASQTLTETDAPLTTSGTLTSTDVDNPDNTFTANTVVGTIGTFAIDAAGAWSFTANSAFDSLNVGDNVNETFTVTSIDGTSSTVTIQINGSNDAATVSSDSQTLTETDAALTTSGTLTSSDVDNTDDSFTANSVVGTIGTFSIDAAGAWSFTANSAFDSLNLGDNVSETYTVTSIDGTSSTVTIQIDGTNDAATVSSASQTLTETDAPVSTSGTLTSTDVDNTDDSFTADTIVGTIGTFTIDAAGAWTFTANSAFDNLNVGDNVNETFNVTSVDGTASTVTIIINGTNDTPTIESTIPDQALSENFATYTIDLNAAFADAETADNALIYGVSGNTAINVSIAGGIATITSTAGWNGSETLTFTATDEGGLSVSQDVVFAVAAVNDLPTIESTIPDQNLSEDFAGYTIDLNAAFADVETTDANLIYGVSGNTNVNVSIVGGIATITATADWNGSETLTFTATDEGGLSVSQDVVFAVAAVADIADDPAVVVVEDTATIIAVLANDSFEGTPVVSGTTAPTNGAVVINGDNTITYTPDADYTGPDSFTYTVTSGGVTETATVTVNVTPVNDPATVSSDSQTLTETDAPLTTSGTLTSTDVDNPDNTFTANTVVGTIGTFAIDAAGAWSFTANSAFDSLNVGHNVNETFTVTSIDGTSSTVTIQINGSNDAATVSSDSQTLTETDAALTTSGTLTSSDVDNTDDSFTANSVVGTIGTFSIDAAGAWSFTANSAFDELNSGDSYTETFNVTSADGTASSVQITINGTNDAATVVDDNVSGNEDTAVVDNILSNDSDVEGDALTASTASGPSNGSLTLNADGSFTYTPNANWNGTDSFTYTANDGALDSNVATVTITVNPVNDTPTVTSSAVTAATEDAAYSYTITTGDIDGDAMTITAPVLPAWLTLADNGNGTATLSGTPTNAEVGDHSVVLQVSDSSSTDTQNFTLNVTEATTDSPVDGGIGTDPGPIFEDPEPDDDDDSDDDVPTYEEPAEDPQAEDVPVPLVDLIPEDSSDADDSFVLPNDPDAQETDEIIYLTDEDDTDLQSEEREDDQSYKYFDNDFYKEIISAKYLNFNSNTPENTQEPGELADSGVIDFASDDWKQVVAKEDYILLREEIDETFSSEQQSNAVKAKIVTASMTTFTVGIASYFLRAGSMVSSLMSSLPLWRGFDPIAIFVGKKKRKKDRNEIPNTDKSKSETLFDGEGQ